MKAMGNHVSKCGGPIVLFVMLNLRPPLPGSQLCTAIGDLDGLAQASHCHNQSAGASALIHTRSACEAIAF